MKFKRTALLEILKENQAKHRKIFEEALEGYKSEILALTEQRLKDLRRNKRVDFFPIVNLPEPRDHTRDYDSVIRMLELTSDSEVELSDEKFRQFVMDDWHWKKEFLETSANYTKIR